MSTSDFGFIKCSIDVFISGYFLTKVFHPNVADNGEICVNTLKKDWKPDLGIKHVLMVGGALECLRKFESQHSRSHFICVVFVRRAA